MKPTRFILVDDDIHNNTICKLYIRYALPQMEVVDFTLPEHGLNYIQIVFSNDVPEPAILLLDIDMPMISGWDFLEKYDELNHKIKNQITIYILSSSLDKRDKDTAVSNKYVKGYLEKPLDIAVIKKIFDECCQASFSQS